MNAEKANPIVEGMQAGARPMPLVLWLCSAFLLAPAGLGAQQASSPPSDLRVLTNVAEVRKLPLEEARRGYPVRLRAVVTYFDYDQGDMFVQDSTGGIYVDPGPTKFSLSPGQVVELVGESGPGDFASEIHLKKVQTVGEAPLPRPLKVSGEELVSGRQDSQWIEVEGVVREAAERQGRLTLDITSGPIQFKAFVLNFRPKAPDLTEAKVAVRGVSSGIYNPKLQLIGVSVDVPSLSEIRVLERPENSLFSIPVRPIHVVLRLAPQGAFNQRVRVQGVVTLQRPGRSLYIRDAQEGLLIESGQDTRLKVGDRVDAVGFPAVGEFSPVLQNAVFRLIGTGLPPEPASISAEQAFQGGFDAELVRMRARLLGRVMRGGALTLVVEEGKYTYEAEMDAPAGSEILASLSSGSLVQLVGICSVQVNENREPRAFRLLLRSPADVVVLERPPWWNLSRLMWALGIMGGLILGAVSWVAVLRAQVRGQTEDLRRSLDREAGLQGRYRELFENAKDIVYSADLEGKLTSLNKAGEEATGYTREEALQMNLDQIVAPEHARLAREMVAWLVAGGGPCAFELDLVTKDGRRLPVEVGTRLIREQGKPAGIQGIARDMTDRKRAEQALRLSEERFHKAFNSSPEPMTISTLADGRYIDVNESFLRITGHARDKVIGRTALELKFWLDAADRAKMLDVLTKQGNVRELEITFGIPSGEKRTGRLSAEVIDVAGQACLLAVTQDITDRKRAEEALHHLPARLMQLQDEERRRIARELHDSTGQGLAALVMCLGALKNSTAKMTGTEKSALSESLALAKQASREVRTLSYLLYPPMLDEFGLAAALRGYVEGFRKRSGIHVELDVPVEFDRLTRELEVAILRVVQEGLTNIQRHSGSKIAKIRVHSNDGVVKVEVQDEGHGMAPKNLKAIEKGGRAVLGVGILGMRERITQLGGTFEIQSSRRGTALTAVLPLQKYHS